MTFCRVCRGLGILCCDLYSARLSVLRRCYMLQAYRPLTRTTVDLLEKLSLRRKLRPALQRLAT